MSLTVGTGSVLTGCLAYYLVKKFTSRPLYSVDRVREHEKNRIRLLQEFHAQPVTFTTEDGITLSGLLLVREGAKRNLLVCHGYRMAKERMVGFASMFSKDNILLFDHRAHGQSGGTCTTIGFNEKKDVLAALKVLQNHAHLNKLPTFGIGVSMGAVSLLGAACESCGFKGVVLDSPFARLDEQARRIFTRRYKLPHHPFESIGTWMFTYLMKFSLAEVNSLHWAERIQAPVLLIHSVKDHVASFNDAKRLYEKIPTKKELWVVNESGHARIFTDCSTEYQKRVDQFFATV